MSTSTLRIKFLVYAWCIAQIVSGVVYASEKKTKPLPIQPLIFDPKAVRLVCKRDAQGVLYMQRVTEEEYQKAKFSDPNLQHEQQAGSVQLESATIAEKTDPVVVYAGASFLRRNSILKKNSDSSSSSECSESCAEESHTQVGNVIASSVTSNKEQEVFSLEEELMSENLSVKNKK